MFVIEDEDETENNQQSNDNSIIDNNASSIETWKSPVQNEPNDGKTEHTNITSLPTTPNIVNSSQLYIVYQLQQQVESIRNQYITRGLQCDDLQRQMEQCEIDKV